MSFRDAVKQLYDTTHTRARIDRACCIPLTYIPLQFVISCGLYVVGVILQSSISLSSISSGDTTRNCDWGLRILSLFPFAQNRWRAQLTARIYICSSVNAKNYLFLSTSMCMCVCSWRFTQHIVSLLLFLTYTEWVRCGFSAYRQSICRLIQEWWFFWKWPSFYSVVR